MWDSANQMPVASIANDDAGILRAAAYRQLNELKLPAVDKLRLAANKGIRVIGLLNDDSSSVGRRHFAVLLGTKSRTTYWNSHSEVRNRLTS